jgi:hypothetical protein
MCDKLSESELSTFLLLIYKLIKVIDLNIRDRSKLLFRKIVNIEKLYMI